MNSSGRTAQEADLQDIIDVFQKLDNLIPPDQWPTFVAAQLDRLPSFNPTQTVETAVMERLRNLENRVDSNEAVLSMHGLEFVKIGDKINNVKPCTHNTNQNKNHTDDYSSKQTRSANQSQRYSDQRKTNYSVPSRTTKEKDTCTEPDVPVREMYSTIASKDGPWQQSSADRKRQKKLSRQESKRLSPLRPCKPESVCTLYLKNITMNEDEEYYHVCAKVKDHAESKDVKLMKTRIITNRYCDYIVGCKMLVSEKDKETLLEENFWPEGFECREWEEYRKPYKTEYPDYSNAYVSVDSDTNSEFEDFIH